MYGTTTTADGSRPGSVWQVTTATSTTATTLTDDPYVFYVGRSDSNVGRPSAEEIGLRKAAAHSAAIRASRKLSLDPHPDRRAASVPRPGPRRVSCDFHWMSQRKRCQRMRAPVPGYDRA